MGSQAVKSVEDRTRIVLAVSRRHISIAEASRREALSLVSISRWRDQYLASGTQG